MQDIEELPTSRALPTEEALRYATVLAEVLRQMHRDGTVCGRLDPKNIVWDSHRARLTLPDAAGAGAYLAPEQVREKPPMGAAISSPLARFFMKSSPAEEPFRPRTRKS